MTPASWVPEKGRMTSEEREREREMDCARELNRGRCTDMWVSPQGYQNTNKIYVKPLGVMVGILGTPCCNTMLDYILLKQTELKLLLKQVQQGVYHRWAGVLYIVI